MSCLCSCLQAMSSSLAPGGEVNLSCSAETSCARCLQVFGGTSVKRVNGFEMKELAGKLWYQRSCTGASERTSVYQSGDENMVGVFLCFHQLAVLGQHVSTFMYLCL